MAETDFYSVLKLPVTASASEIRAAYRHQLCHLVPELHADELRRLRIAYDVLRPAVMRDEYDRRAALQGETKACLDASLTAILEANWLKAQVNLQAVREAQPDLQLPRWLLALVYLHSEQATDALRECVALCRAFPDEPAYALRCGQIYQGSRNFTAALPCFARVRDLDQDEPLGVFGVADCEAGLQHWDAALETLAPLFALSAEQRSELFQLALQLRRVEYLVQKPSGGAELEEELRQLAKAAPLDDQKRLFSARKLGAIALHLLDTERPGDAEHFLRRVHELGLGAKAPSYQFPAKFVRPLAELTPQSRERIEHMAQEPPVYLRKNNPYRGINFLLFSALILLVLPWWILRPHDEQFTGTGLGILAGVLFIGPLLGLLVTDRMRRIYTSRVGSFSAITPLYLMMVNLDTVTVWPLVQLRNVRLVHYIVNNRYRGTTLYAEFGEQEAKLYFQDEDTAKDWQQALSRARNRCISTHRIGLIDQEEGFDILPTDVLLTPRAAVPFFSQPAVARYGVVLLGAALYAGGGVLWNNRRIEDKLWNRATYDAPDAVELRQYLRLYPHGRHAKESRTLLQQIYQQAKQRYLAQAGDAPARDAIVDVLATLQEAPSQTVAIVYRGAVDFTRLGSVPPPSGPPPLAPSPAFTAEQNREREAMITSTLVASFQRILPGSVLTFKGTSGADRTDPPDPQPAAAASAVRFEIDYTVVPSGTLYQNPRDQSTVYGIQLAWTLRITTPRTRAGGTPYALTLLTRPAARIVYSTSYQDYMMRTYRRALVVSGDQTIAPYSAMAISAFDEFGRKVAAECGFHIDPPPLPEPEEFTPEQELQLQAYARRLHVSPEAVRDSLRSGELTLPTAEPAEATEPPIRPSRRRAH